MSIATKFTKRMGVKYPIMCGGMYHVGEAELATSVSNAGGLGTITALSFGSPEALDAEITKCKTLTDKPFGINLTLLPMLKPPNYIDYADVVVKHNIKVVETAGHINGLAEFIDIFKANGIAIIHKCTQVRHAKTAAKLGADFVTIDGIDAAVSS